MNSSSVLLHSYSCTYAPWKTLCDTKPLSKFQNSSQYFVASSRQKTASSLFRKNLYIPELWFFSQLFRASWKAGTFVPTAKSRDTNEILRGSVSAFSGQSQYYDQSESVHLCTLTPPQVFYTHQQWSSVIFSSPCPRSVLKTNFQEPPKQFLLQSQVRSSVVI